ncbi:pyrimidine 5'-nucleotidase [Paramagnetospirillum kuznetsovii]|uniref:Pyrimidine 5'-nucleotidase n=1 Tax=Paramagnetospirillum kuznetsovii TaxID=2053833 RepID=A0A364P0N2_9PROT|nr:pyrimidine 5'-nucleotidase [Paramagnetospirillum kuznetsovii]RAU22863.1 pyrimidine 5'-nucleotidase [Paramagnetospirillum kuznetsovii]
MADDLSRVETWVFDLDNTLYPASSSLFPQIDIRMRRFIAERLGLSLDEAFTLQKRYYREFGTTLRGLMLVHKIEPDAFLSFVHDIDCTVLDAAPRLDAALARLQGRKLIFTNGSERHAENVLARLGIARHFEGIFDIRAAAFVPKPQPECYKMMVERHAVDPRAALMVEDIHRNLAPAAAIGMTTLWVREDGHPDSAVLKQDDADLSHVHHITDDLTRWLEAVPGQGRI